MPTTTGGGGGATISRPCQPQPPASNLSTSGCRSLWLRHTHYAGVLSCCCCALDVAGHRRIAHCQVITSQVVVHVAALLCCRCCIVIESSHGAFVFRVTRCCRVVGTDVVLRGHVVAVVVVVVVHRHNHCHRVLLLCRRWCYVSRCVVVIVVIVASSET
jgi:hypothetical protein